MSVYQILFDLLLTYCFILPTLHLRIIMNVHSYQYCQIHSQKVVTQTYHTQK